MKKSLAKRQRSRIPQSVRLARSLLPVRRRGAKWIVDMRRYTPDVPEWGDYDTRQDAEDDRNGVIRTRAASEVLAIIEQNRRQETGNRKQPGETSPDS